MRAFAQACGINKNTLWNYTHGVRPPNPEACAKIAAALGVPKAAVLRQAGVFDDDRVAFHRADAGSGQSPLQAAASNDLDALMGELLTDPRFKEMLATKWEDADALKAKQDEILHYLDALNQRVAYLESKRLKGD